MSNAIRIPVDITNPGQFFACCGLLEVAGRIRPGLNRLKQANRGVRSGTSWTAAAGSQQWVLDTLGNWLTMRNDLMAPFGTFADSGDTQEDRTHDFSNQLSQRTQTAQGSSPVTLPNASFDDAGNLRDSPRNPDEQDRFTYDAWNRVVSHKVVPSPGSSDGFTANIGSYSYNGLHWRTKKVSYSIPSETRWFVYSASWQLVQENIHSDAYASFDLPAKNHCVQEFFGVRYIDDPVLRRVKVPTGSSGEGDTPNQFIWSSTNDWDYYHLTDVQFSTVAMVRAASKSAVIERVRYNAYGAASYSHGCDINFDGVVDFGGDYLDFVNSGKLGKHFGDSAYDVLYDFNRDGVINGDDLASMNDQTDRYVASGAISDASVPESQPAGPDNGFGFDGYVFNPESQLYMVRFRMYSPDLGRWVSRDPAGYIDHLNLYQYVSGCPQLTDALGLTPSPDMRAAIDRQARLDGYLRAIRALLSTLPDICDPSDSQRGELIAHLLKEYIHAAPDFTGEVLEKILEHDGQLQAFQALKYLRGYDVLTRRLVRGQGLRTAADILESARYASFVTRVFGGLIFTTKDLIMWGKLYSEGKRLEASEYLAKVIAGVAAMIDPPYVIALIAAELIKPIIEEHYASDAKAACDKMRSHMCETTLNAIRKLLDMLAKERVTPPSPSGDDPIPRPRDPLKDFHLTERTSFVGHMV